MRSLKRARRLPGHHRPPSSSWSSSSTPLTRHHRLTTTTAAATDTTDTTTTATTVSPPTPISSLLIANRGEIALRIQRTAHRLGIETTTVHTDPDAAAQHAGCGTRPSLCLGPAAGYLDGARIVELARQRAVGAVHPGYGFLSENAGFADRCERAGIVFVGPPGSAMAAMGDKARSKDIMTAAGVRCVPGYHGPEQEEAQLLRRAAEVGFPVLLKSVRGGGGKGMRIVGSAAEFAAQLRSARAEARASFGDGGEVMLVERYIRRPRHVEVQVFADRHGGCVALGERDCSVQRRHQKILEESPAPDLGDAVRAELWDRARRAALAVGYVGAGTVEFILDRDTAEFFFMEMNTRLQVEHPVTEMVTGTDLVEWQLRIAAGEPLPLTQDEIAARICRSGSAIEARIYAEDPGRGFVPDSGPLLHLRTPATGPDVRIDAGFAEGDVVSEAYDGMLAKLIVRGPDRRTAIRRLGLALREYEVVGLRTNIEFLKRVCRTAAFVEGDVETGFIDRWRPELFAPAEVADEVLVQAALGVLGRPPAGSPPRTGGIGFGGDAEARQLRFRPRATGGGEGEGGSGGDEVADVLLIRTGPDTYSAAIARHRPSSSSSPSTRTIPSLRAASHTTSPPASSLPAAYSLIRSHLVTHFPECRAESTVVITSDASSPSPSPVVAVFHDGARTDLALEPAKWVAAVLGSSMTEAAASVVAPMPCKILRNEVAEGQEVEKGAALVVIESMKMETVIRSPQRGRIKKLAHKEGDICKAGTVLVLFEESAEEGA